jgi:flagellar L-ring protein FlgH
MKMNKYRWPTILALAILSGLPVRAAKKQQAPAVSALDQYIEEATQSASAPQAGAPGSVWSPSAQLADMSADLRARYVNDVVTILVTDQVSATATGSTKTKRSSSASASVNALGGLTRAPGPWTNLADVTGATQLDGEGSTNRATTFTTSLAARVTRVLPNGYLVVEGSKTVNINSELQIITVRGVVRPIDLTTTNIVRSDRLAQLEVRANGKGVVGDAIKRPFILYRILMGLLPF